MSDTTPVGLREVATAAEVSVSTVSRALDPRRRHLLSKETCRRVSEAAERLNYSSNLVARRFKRQRSEAITFVLPQAAFGINSVVDFSSHSGVLTWQMIEGMTRAARELAYDLKLEPLFDNADPEELMQALKFPHADGAIFAGSAFLGEAIAAAGRSGVPFLVVDSSPSREFSFPEVSVDVRLGVSEAAQHLLETGHRRIGYLSMSLGRVPRLSQRFSAYRDVLEMNGVFDPALHVTVGDRHELRQWVDSFGKQPPMTALMCSNDTLAVMAIDLLRERGLRVPEDMAVVGYDDNPAYLEMGLSTVHIPRRELGQEAVRSLVQMLVSGRPMQAKKLLPSTFVPRTTSTPQ